MRVGTVLDLGRLYPTAKLEIEGVGNASLPLAAVIDTGFSEWLALPAYMVRQLELRFAGREQLIFGNSARAMINVYEARVYWSKSWRTVRVHEVSGDPTIGMELLRGHRIEFDALGDSEIDVEAVVRAGSK